MGADETRNSAAPSNEGSIASIKKRRVQDAVKADETLNSAAPSNEGSIASIPKRRTRSESSPSLPTEGKISSIPKRRSVNSETSGVRPSNVSRIQRQRQDASSPAEAGLS